MKSFLQHINEAPMTTGDTQGRGDGNIIPGRGSSRPAQRSDDGTDPRDQSTEDGNLIPHAQDVGLNKLHLDYMTQIMRDKYPQMGDPSSEDALPPGIVHYLLSRIKPYSGWKPTRRPLPQDLLDWMDAPWRGYPAKEPGFQGPRHGIGGGKPGPFPFGVPGKDGWV